MNYIKITKCDIANGPGCRATLWVSGCNHHCLHCHNPDTWSLNVGKCFTADTMNELISDALPNYISGLTFSGGDPLHPENYSAVMTIAKIFKEKFPDKTIWLWTGYLWEEIKCLYGIQNIDVLIDGEFVESLKDLSLKWRGSSNQRVIDVKKSLESNEIVLYKEQ